ncbi:MAG: helix-turn-helix domain-containing protein, partial [Pseudomonadota bacterium]
MSNKHERSIAKIVDKSVDKLDPRNEPFQHGANTLDIVQTLPESARTYVAHVHGAVSIRALARVMGKHPSTVLRQVRKMESLRDDPLVDQILDTIGSELDGRFRMKQDRATD